MKNWKLILVLLCLGDIPAQAKIAGKLDILSDPQAIVLRDVRDGLWLIGLQKNVWKMVNTEKYGPGKGFESEILHLSFFVATRLEGQAPTYGPSIGTNVGSLVGALAYRLELLRAAGDAFPPWLGKLASWTSLDVYGGYRPVLSHPDEHRWMYGIGGQVRIPFGAVAKWAAGTDGVKGL